METKKICEAYLKNAPAGAEVTEVERINKKQDYVVTYQGRVIYDPIPSNGFIKSLITKEKAAIEVVEEKQDVDIENNEVVNEVVETPIPMYTPKKATKSKKVIKK